MGDAAEMMDLGFSIQVAETLTERGRYTAELFEQRYPDKYAMCVQALALSFSLNKIAKALGVAWETVAAVRRRVSPESLREHKKRLSGLCFSIVEQRLEQLVEDPEAIKKLGMLDIGILADKGLTLAGEASMITETRVVDPAVVAFQEFMSQMVSGGGEVLAKGRVVESEGAGSGLEPLGQELQHVDNERQTQA